MTSLEVDDSIYFGDMRDGILEKNQVHLDELWLHVVVLQLVIQVLSEFGEVSHLLVYRHVLVHEVHKDGILATGGAVLSVVHLEVSLQLLIQVSLELLSIFK